MPKKESKKKAPQAPSLAEAVSLLLTEQLQFSQPQEVKLDAVEGLVVLEGDRPAIFISLIPPGEPITPEKQNLAELAASQLPQGTADFVWATNSADLADGYFFSWLEERQVSGLPTRAKWQELVAKSKAGPARAASSASDYKVLQKEFDDLHEYIYAARENVNGKNDITYELCKCIFLKMHLEQHPDYKLPQLGLTLEQVLDAERIANKRDSAVHEIKSAFQAIRDLDEYNLTGEDGHSFQIWDPADAIRLNKPDTFVHIFGMLGKHTLSKLDDDILGRAFDVMLRAKFESKGGVGIYLTPQQVRDAMVETVFFDILKEDPGLLTRRDPKTGKPVFRMTDLCSGSGGFLVTAMREARRRVNALMGLTDAQKKSLLRDIYEHCFIGMDNAPGMVLMARINMALHGDPKSRIFQVSNSLTEDIIAPESLDLILTNPPFKKGGIRLDTDHGNEILKLFTSDIVASRCGMRGDKLALGAKPDKSGKWNPVKSVDPAVLFIDRCLQLLKPGGRLVIVVPDGILRNSGDRYVREYIMGVKNEETGKFVGGKAVVKAVVSLPPVTFRLSGAGAKTSFLYLQKKRPGDEQGPIYMAVANKVGFDIKANKETLIEGGKPIPNDLVKIVEGYREGPKLEPGTA